MLDILHIDNDLLILNKPPNMLCVPGLSTPDNLFDFARSQYPNARVVHRLDMATSGIIIFALNHASQKHLGKQFEKRVIKKRYCALVSGQVSQRNGEISLPLICDWDNRPKQKVDWHNGKAAHTYFETDRFTQTLANTEHNQIARENKISSTNGYTYLNLYPITGRSHQLRVHCLALGHPIVGDKLYNVTEASVTQRMCLHAERIQFAHPSHGDLMVIESAVPF